LEISIVDGNDVEHESSDDDQVLESPDRQTAHFGGAVELDEARVTIEKQRVSLYHSYFLYRSQLPSMRWKLSDSTISTPTFKTRQKSTRESSRRKTSSWRSSKLGRCRTTRVRDQIHNILATNGDDMTQEVIDRMEAENTKNL
jgi:hypothetical protein